MADLICGLAKEDYPCRSCYGFGGEFTPADEWERCPDCSGTGDGRPVVLRKIAEAIEREYRNTAISLSKFTSGLDIARWIRQEADEINEMTNEVMELDPYPNSGVHPTILGAIEHRVRAGADDDS